MRPTSLQDASPLRRVRPQRALIAALVAASLLSACPQERAPAAAADPRAGAPIAASEKALVPGKGSVEGTVRLIDPPQLPPLPTTPSVSDVCGPAVEDLSLRVGREGALAEAIVYLDVPEGPVLEHEVPPVLDQKGCRYHPAVGAARAGSTLKVRNSDPLVHNVRSVAEGRSLFNVAMPLEGMHIERKLPAIPGVVAVGCDLHPWMRSTVRTFKHGWFTLTDAQGAFRLHDLPEGRHTLKVWHPRLPEQSFEVELSASAPARIAATWSGTQVRGIEALPGSQR